MRQYNLVAAAGAMALSMAATAGSIFGGDRWPTDPMPESPAEYRARRRQKRYARAYGELRPTKGYVGVPRYKGSSEAKRAARMVVRREKNSARFARAAKYERTGAHGFAAELVRRHKAGSPVAMTYSQVIEMGVDAFRVVHDKVLRGVGPGFGWRKASPEASILQLVAV